MIFKPVEGYGCIETVGAGNRLTQQTVGDNSGNINHTEPGLWLKIKKGGIYSVHSPPGTRG